MHRSAYNNGQLKAARLTNYPFPVGFYHSVYHTKPEIGVSFSFLLRCFYGSVENSYTVVGIQNLDI